MPTGGGYFLVQIIIFTMYDWGSFVTTVIFNTIG